MEAFQGCTLKESSSSECMLLSERSSGSLSSSLVKVVDESSPWFCITRFRSARISLSCRASTAFRSWIPERSEAGQEREGRVNDGGQNGTGLQSCFTSPEREFYKLKTHYLSFFSSSYIRRNIIIVRINKHL